MSKSDASTMLKFLLLINKQGQPRITQYYEHIDNEDRIAFETDVIRKCLGRNDKQCSFFDYKNLRVIYRRYATLYFIVGVDEEENELAILEFIHNLVETFDAYFEKVCELDIMFNLDKVHMILDEMVANGRIVESNRRRILAPIQVLDLATSRR